MTTLVLDASALIGLDRGDRRLWAKLVAASDPNTIHVPAGVIAQAWRGGTRQARLARALKLCHEVPMDGRVARDAGTLCGQTDTVDVIDASVVVTAARAVRSGDVGVVTSDRHDIGVLLAALGTGIRIVDV